MAKTLGKRKKKQRLIAAFLASLCSQWPFSAEPKRLLGELGTAIGKAVSQKRSWSTGSNADLHPLRMGYNSQCGC